MRNIKGKISLILIVLLIATAGCTNKDIEAAKQIEDYLQQQEQQLKSFTNIDIANLSSQNAKNTIKEFASEKYKGRKTGTEGNEKAVQYIANYFKSIGLENPKGLNNYLQPYYQAVTLFKSVPKLELLNKAGTATKSYEYPKNFVFRVLSDSTEDIKLQSTMKIMESIADLEKADFANNAVLLFSLKAQGRSDSIDIMREVYPTKAAAIIIEMDANGKYSHFSDLTVTSLNSQSWGKQFKPVIGVDSQTFAELSSAAGEGLEIKVESSYEIHGSYKANNIVGYIPGNDEKLKDEYIIICGHMDHVGDNLNGTYNPGVFDNASGTAAMMEIARLISENPVKPLKTIVFIAFNGEEYGLNGSEYYVEYPVFPLENAAVINLDMVGSSYTVPLSIANGDEYVSDLKLEFLELAKNLGIEAVTSKIKASDHSNFGSKRVPAVLLTHMDDMHGYHSPNDTLEDINNYRIEEVMKLVLYYIDKKAY